MVCIHCRRRNDRECKTAFSVNSKDAAKLRICEQKSTISEIDVTCSVKIVSLKSELFLVNCRIFAVSQSRSFIAPMFFVKWMIHDISSCIFSIRCCNIALCNTLLSREHIFCANPKIKYGIRILSNRTNHSLLSLEK